MTFFELEKMLKHLNDKEKQHMEELRLVKHAILLPHSIKGLELTDVMRFPWDMDNKEDDFELII